MERLVGVFEERSDVVDVADDRREVLVRLQHHVTRERRVVVFVCLVDPPEVAEPRERSLDCLSGARTVVDDFGRPERLLVQKPENPHSAVRADEKRDVVTWVHADVVVVGRNDRCDVTWTADGKKRPALEGVVCTGDEKLGTDDTEADGEIGRLTLAPRGQTS